jgi:hypothetical protein
MYRQLGVPVIITPAHIFVAGYFWATHHPLSRPIGGIVHHGCSTGIILAALHAIMHHTTVGSIFSGLSRSPIA